MKKCLTLALLSESRHIIWTSRNLIKHENKTLRIFQIVSTFLSKIKLRILADRQRLSSDDFLNSWVQNGFCGLDLIENKLIFHPMLNMDFYISEKFYRCPF